MYMAATELHIVGSSGASLTYSQSAIALVVEDSRVSTDQEYTARQRLARAAGCYLG